MAYDVLLVDDNDDLRDMMCLFLQQEGFAVRAAADGRDALDLLHSGFRPAVILLDLMMPRMSGVEFRAVQRSDAELATIPVIAVTAAGEPVIQEANADAVFRKPLDFDALVDALTAFCSSPDPTAGSS